MADPGQRNKNTTVPKSRLNRILVTEVLVLAKCHEVRHDTDIPLDEDLFWQALDKTQLEVRKKIRRCGDGKVESDATHEHVIVQVSDLLRGHSNDKKDDGSNSKQSDGEESEIDLEEAMKEQDDNASVGEVTVFSDDDVDVVDIEREEFVQGLVYNETMGDDESVGDKDDDIGDAEPDNADSPPNDESQIDETQPDSQIEETQPEEVLLVDEDDPIGNEDEENEDDKEDGKEAEDYDKQDEDDEKESEKEGDSYDKDVRNKEQAGQSDPQDMGKEKEKVEKDTSVKKAR